MYGDKRLTVKLLPAHKRALERLSRADGESVSAVVRGLIRAEAERRGVWTTTVKGRPVTSNPAHKDSLVGALLPTGPPNAEEQ
jgi:hypothetical protein